VLSLPVAVGQQILERIGTMIGTDGNDRAISFANCLLAGPMPYRGNDIGFFGGVYRVERGNWADTAFDLVADLTSEFGVDISKYTNLGRKLLTGLPGLLNMGSDDWRCGHYGPLYKEGDDYFDRHLILLSDEGPELGAGALEVRQEDSQEALHIRNGGGSRPFTERDFALFRLRSRKTRGDYARFKFNDRFREARDLLTQGSPERAEWAHLQLLQEISNCADLTDGHQLQLAAAFDLKFKEWEQLIQSRKQARRGGGTVMSRGKTDDAIKEAIGVLAQTAQRKQAPQATVDTFLGLARNLKQVRQSLPDRGEDGLSDQDIDGFLSDEKTRPLFQGSSADFVDAIKAERLQAGGQPSWPH